MTVLSFKLTGNSLVRTDMNSLVTFTRNNAAAKFDFDEEWAGVSPVAAQFRKSDECCYDVFVEDGVCAIPWEVLEEKGTLYVSVMGGDLITTNCVTVSVIDTGIVGGLVPTAASPSVYSAVMEALEKIEADYEGIVEKAENIESLTEELEELKNRISELESSVKESFENVNENIGLCNEAVADETERAEEAEEKLSDRIDTLSSSVSDEIGELELAVDENRDKLTVYSSYAYIDDDGFGTTDFRSWESGTQFNKGDVLILYINSIDTDEVISVGNINVDGTDYNCTTFEGDDISVEEISVNSFVFLVYDGSGFNISKADGE